MNNKPKITLEEFESINSNDELRALIDEKGIPFEGIQAKIDYENELKSLQVELIKLQQWVTKTNRRVAVIFEGRDAAGKGGNIRRFMEHLNPRSMRLVALNKPTEIERGQWYFRRYVKELPNPGEIVFFDRSWYNRAVVEPVMGFCSKEQYKTFLVQVPEFEHMLYEDGITIIKFWLSITKEEQLKRFDARNADPVKRWKFSPVDKKGQEMWDKYTFYKDEMFSNTHTSYSPWVIVKTNDKKKARVECMRYVLSRFNYEGKDEAKIHLNPDPNVVMRYYRSVKNQID